MTLAALMDEILQRHHLRLHRELPALDFAFRERGVAGPFLAWWTELRTLLEMHLAKEEGILFPAIRALEEDGTMTLGFGLDGPIGQMCREHRRMDELTAVLRLHAREAGDLTDDLLDLLDDLEVHAAREDDELFPAAADLSEAV
jgi:iron-sulfur cluster repair protein YtfE (RIC family)